MDDMICEVCGKQVGTMAIPSVFGGLSFWCCDDCAANHYEPYDVIVAGIACAGEWPGDVIPGFQQFVYDNLKFYRKTEEEFSYDVTHCFDGLIELVSSVKATNEDRPCM